MFSAINSVRGFQIGLALWYRHVMLLFKFYLLLLYFSFILFAFAIYFIYGNVLFWFWFDFFLFKLIIHAKVECGGFSSKQSHYKLREQEVEWAYTEEKLWKRKIFMVWWNGVLWC